MGFVEKEAARRHHPGPSRPGFPPEMLFGARIISPRRGEHAAPRSRDPTAPGRCEAGRRAVQGETISR